eukprot:maker-scaffold185_size275389-snap-gene-0.14 protein:Tk02507 transcript:maker-scaffold185_size275389-snap-gene-0.14-mRNA-1 annotation:"catenin alpha"
MTEHPPNMATTDIRMMNGSNGYGSNGTAANLAMQWNPKHLEIKTRSVEKTLEPLVMQVTTLVSSKSPQKKKGKSKRAPVLVAAVERATGNFVDRGRQIARENPEIEPEMLSAVDEVHKTGEQMSSAAKDFASDPCSSAKRGNMVRAARNLLSAVTRLLILADMIDVHLLLKKLQRVEDDIEHLKSVSSQAELIESMKRFGVSAQDLMNQAAKRQYELKDPAMRDDLAAARAVLKKHSMMLLTASKAYVRHPELAAAKANRDFVLKQVCEAVNTISDVAQGKTPKGGQSLFEGPGELAAALDDFDDYIIINPLTYDESMSRPSLEERLESIISGAALMADSSCTRDERRERIVAECNSVRQALQDLLTQYMTNAGDRPTEQLDQAIEAMCQKTKDLRRQLRKAVVDHVSDSFLEADGPLMMLIAAAQEGKEQEVEEYAAIFNDHAAKLVEVAKLACSMSNNEDGLKMVRYAASQIENLCPQVINAARVLGSRPRSKVAQENIEVFRDAWANQVRILTDAVDEITTVDDFLAVSENHILEDVNKCVAALQSKDPNAVDRTAGAIRGRSGRICNVVASEMDNYEPGFYTERVLEAIKLLSNNVMPNFAQKVEGAVHNLSLSPQGPVDENEFIDATRLVYDGVREIRRAVLLNRGRDVDIDSDTEWENPEVAESEVASTRPDSTTTELVDEYPDISGITNAREAMKKLPEEDRQKIMQQVETFKDEKRKFDLEVSKWDDNGNDVIVLAKHMCTIMMEMTDFTRGKGPLGTTMAVIGAAKRISEAGTKLDKLARQIADMCPESSTKKDLLAYLQRIALYCHQLNITSKNLMNAVVLTVKASYVASTKYKRLMTESDHLNSPVVWKMKVPEKKPLVRREAPDEIKAKVRRGSQKKPSNPVKALSEFQSPDEMI